MRRLSLSERWIAVAGPVAFAAVSCLVHAGQLEPPGPVGSTMQTAIRAASLPLTITQPGLYVLEGDIDAAGGGGITINSSNVTIDLRGHSLSNGTGDAIHGGFQTMNNAVKNGAVSGWSGDGVDLVSSANSQIVGVRSQGNVGSGIRIGSGGLISECTSRGNTFHGFDLNGTGTVISECVSSSNEQSGISVPTGPASISHCVVHGNSANGISGGIDTNGVVMTDCSVRDNGDQGIHLGSASVVSRCTVYNNGDGAGDDGILVGAGSSVTDCTVEFNAEDGIQTTADSLVARNNCDNNGQNVTGAGIHVGGNGNRIEANNVTDNDRGILVEGTGSLIIRNSAGGNAIEYSIVGGNTVGPIVTSAGIAASTNPHANYEY